MKYILWLIVGMCLVWGIYVRGYSLSRPSLWIDEGYSSIVSLEQFRQGTPWLPSGRFEFAQYFFTLSQSLSYSIFGVNDFASRFPSLILSLISGLVFFFFARSLTRRNDWGQWFLPVVVLIYWFSYWQIVWAREARFYEMLALMCLIGLWCLWEYSQTKKQTWWWGFVVIAGLGWIFHPFCGSLFLIGGMLIVLELWEAGKEKNFTSFSSIIFSHRFQLLGLGIIYLGYLSWGYIVSLLNDPTSSISLLPKVYEISEEIQKGYVRYYLEHLWSQLGILFPVFLGGLCYFAYTMKTRELVVFGGFFVINFYFITRKGILAHSRYMYHLHAEIILLGTYFLFLAGTYISGFFPKKQKLFFLITGILVSIGIFLSVPFQFLPRNFYEIDFTSPKPDFKGAYEYLDTQKADHIISGFPHLCIRYSQKNPQRCQWAWRLNLSMTKEGEKSIKQFNREWYVNIPYIEELPKNSNIYYVVIDHLSRKNTVNPKLIHQVEETCTKVWEKIVFARVHNSIEVRKCD